MNSWISVVISHLGQTLHKNFNWERQHCYNEWQHFIIVALIISTQLWWPSLLWPDISWTQNMCVSVVIYIICDNISVDINTWQNLNFKIYQLIIWNSSKLKHYFIIQDVHEILIFSLGLSNHPKAFLYRILWAILLLGPL